MANIYDLTDTWSDGATTYTSIKMNVTDTASAAASKLIDLQVGGSSLFSVDKVGKIADATELQVDNVKLDGNTVSSTTGNLVIDPYAGAKISLDGLLWPNADGSANQVLSTNGAGTLAWVAQTAAFTTADVDAHLNQSNPTSGHVLSWNGSDYAWVAQTGGSSYGDSDVNAHLNQSSATTGQLLSWNGSDYAWITSSSGGGSYADTDVDAHLNQSTAQTNEVLSWNGSDYAWVANSGGGLADVVDDATPQLGGDLDLNSNNVTGTGNINISGTITTTSGGSVVPFYYANQAAFPSATTYHGAVAHSHADGAMYFAHGGSWNKLADTTAATTSAAGLMAAADKTKLDAINQALSTTSDVQFNDLVLAGDLTVNGTNNIIDTTNLAVSDSLIELSNGLTTAPVNDAGIVIERGTADNAFIGWDESEDKFVLGTGSFTGSDTGNLTITKGDVALGTLTTQVDGSPVDVRTAHDYQQATAADIVGGATLYNATTAITLTMDTTKLGAGDIATIYAGNGNVTIAQDATNPFTTIKIDGSTTAVTGNRTIASGSLATITVVSAGVAVIAGQGVS